MSDGQLLDYYVAQRDEAAFTALVRRHGPMVLGVCQRLLHDPHEAEDAFQATFIVLLRKAGSIARRELLGNWLYGVAYRVALKMRGAATRRLARTGQAEEDMATAATTREPGWDDLCPVLDEEVHRLPPKYRTAVVLCYLEGKTNEEAAQQLHCPVNTVKSRLARARDRLRQQLARRGIPFSATGLAAILGQDAGSAALPAPLVDSLGRTAAALAAGTAAAETLSPTVLTVVEGVLKTMALNKLKMALVVILTIGLLGGSAWVLLPHAGAQAPVPPAPTATEPAATAPPATDGAQKGDPAPKAKEQPAAAEAKPKVETLWGDLLTTNESKIVRTVLALSSTPKETVVFFKENLRPVKIDAKRVDQLIADLDSSEFAARHKAEEQLEYLGKYVRPRLRKALADKPSLDVSKRIDALMKRVPYDPMDEAEDLLAELKKDPKNKTVRDKLIKVLGGAPGAGQYGVLGRVENQNQFALAGQPAMSTPTPAPAGPSPLWLRAKRAIMVLEHIATPEARDLLKALADGEPDALPTKEAKAALERLANPNAKVESEPEPVPTKEAPAPAGAVPVTAPAPRPAVIGTKSSTSPVER
jgi:RNA polymerase sigma factor (sigma-70 family)